MKGNINSMSKHKKLSKIPPFKWVVSFELPAELVGKGFEITPRIAAQMVKKLMPNISLETVHTKVLQAPRRSRLAGAMDLVHSGAA